MDSVEARAVIRFLYLKGRTRKETFDEMKETYGDDAPTYGVVKHWHRHTTPYVGASSPCLFHLIKSLLWCATFQIQEPDDSSGIYRFHFFTRLHFSTCKRRIKMILELQITTSPIKICTLVQKSNLTLIEVQIFQINI